MLTEFKHYFREKTQLSEEDLESLASTTSAKFVKKGTILLKQDDVFSKILFVSKGLLRSYTIDRNGKEHVVNFAPENNWIGDRSSFYFNQPSLFFIDAIEDAEVVFIGKEFYEKGEKLSSSFSSHQIRILHSNALMMQKRINMLLAATAEERYLDFIERYPDLLLRVPQWMIATYLGVTPESLSRVRKELAKKNFRTS